MTEAPRRRLGRRDDRRGRRDDRLGRRDDRGGRCDDRGGRCDGRGGRCDGRGRGARRDDRRGRRDNRGGCRGADSSDRSSRNCAANLSRGASADRQRRQQQSVDAIGSAPLHYAFGPDEIVGTEFAVDCQLAQSRKRVRPELSIPAAHEPLTRRGYPPILARHASLFPDPQAYRAQLSRTAAGYLRPTAAAKDRLIRVLHVLQLRVALFFRHAAERTRRLRMPSTNQVAAERRRAHCGASQSIVN